MSDTSPDKETLAGIPYQITRFGSMDMKIPAGTPFDAVTRALAAGKAKLRERGGGAFHVWYPYPDEGRYGVALRDAGLGFRQVLGGNPPLAEHYVWIHDTRPDAVPAPSTLIGGVTVIVYGLDRCVLVIREIKSGTGERRSTEKFVSGGMDRSETPYDTAVRETREEVSIDLEELCGGRPEFRIVNGYFKKDARPGNVGDVHFCLACQVPVRILADGKPHVVDPETGADKGELKTKADTYEVCEARWVTEAEARTLAADDEGKLFMRHSVGWFRDFLEGRGFNEPLRAGRGGPDKLSFH